MLVVQWLLVAGVMVALIFTAYYSVKARRSREIRGRGLNTARMNISMGLMLFQMSLVQMLMFSGSTISELLSVQYSLYLACLICSPGCATAPFTPR